MGVRRPNAPWLVTRQVDSGVINEKSDATITAPNVEGYEFVSWIGGTVFGTWSSARFEDVNKQTTLVTATPDERNARNIVCTALYQRASD